MKNIKLSKINLSIMVGISILFLVITYMIYVNINKSQELGTKSSVNIIIGASSLEKVSQSDIELIDNQIAQRSVKEYFILKSVDKCNLFGNIRQNVNFKKVAKNYFSSTIDNYNLDLDLDLTVTPKTAILDKNLNVNENLDRNLNSVILILNDLGKCNLLVNKADWHLDKIYLDTNLSNITNIETSDTKFVKYGYYQKLNDMKVTINFVPLMEILFKSTGELVWLKIKNPYNLVPQTLQIENIPIENKKNRNDLNTYSTRNYGSDESNMQFIYTKEIYNLMDDKFIPFSEYRLKGGDLDDNIYKPYFEINK